MSRRKKKPHGHRANKARPLTDADRDERVVRDVADTFTCSSRMTHYTVHQLDENLDDMDFDIAYNRLAVAMWRDRPGHVEAVTAAITDLLASRERYRAELIAHRQRLEHLMAVPHDEHLHPVEDWLPLIRKHVVDGNVE